jgi:hypothetical protein
MRYTDEQLQAIEHRGGHSLTFAVAGSGKTQMLLGRVRFLLEQGVPPERIRVLAFNKAAARELKERLACALPASLQAPKVSTFHSLGLKLIALFERHELVARLRLEENEAVEKTLALDQGTIGPAQGLGDATAAGLRHPLQESEGGETLLSPFAGILGQREQHQPLSERQFPPAPGPIACRSAHIRRPCSGRRCSRSRTPTSRARAMRRKLARVGFSSPGIPLDIRRSFLGHEHRDNRLH